MIKTNRFALVIRLQKTSSRRLDQGQYIRLSHTASGRLQDFFKTSWSLQDVSRTPNKNVLKTSSKRLKTSWRRLSKMSSVHLQDFFKIYYQLKLFLLIHLQEVCQTSSRRVQHGFETYLEDDYLWKNLSTLHFWDIYDQGTKYPKVNSLGIPKLLKGFF